MVIFLSSDFEIFLILGNGQSRRKFSCFEEGRYELPDAGWTNVLDNFVPIDGTEVCQQKCQEHPDCPFWFYNTDTKHCFLLSKGIPTTCATGKCIRGPRICPLGKIWSD